MNGLFPQGDAVFSSDQVYRYWLTRDLTAGLLVKPDILSTCAFVMLNPSTADANFDDPTIRKCKKLARLWGHTRLVIVNLFAYRATDPKNMWNAWRVGSSGIVGDDNDHHITKAVQDARSMPPYLIQNSDEIRVVVRHPGRVVAAWGRGGTHNKEALRFFRYRCEAVCKLIGTELTCLKENSDGTPVHPLYQPDDSEPMRWRGM